MGRRSSWLRMLQAEKEGAWRSLGMPRSKRLQNRWQRSTWQLTSFKCRWNFASIQKNIRLRGIGLKILMDCFGTEIVQVTALEATASRGVKIAEVDVENLIEMLMSKLIQLDGIVAEGDLKMQRRMQVIFIIFKLLYIIISIYTILVIIFV